VSVQAGWISVVAGGQTASMTGSVVRAADAAHSRALHTLPMIVICNKGVTWQRGWATTRIGTRVDAPSQAR
jgi:hypothetical protein